MGTALMQDDIAKLHAAVGFLRSELGNLSDKIDEQKRETDARFEEFSRETMTEHRKVHDIVVAQSEAVRNLDRDIRDMKPLTDDYRLKQADVKDAIAETKDYREKKAEARGAARLAGWLYTAAGVVGGFVVFLAGQLLEWLTKRPHIPILVILVGLLAIGKALAQHNHAQHHAHYKSWVNKDGKGCCNNDDCGSLKESDERSSGGIIEVRIDGQWCAVQSRHYLKTGNAPDWTTSHVCVDKHPKPGQSMCDRLLCYQPKPLF
jgi:hypothetical protein